jgi:hypothetical protein
MLNADERRPEPGSTLVHALPTNRHRPIEGRRLLGSRRLLSEMRHRSWSSSYLDPSIGVFLRESRMARAHVRRELLFIFQGIFHFRTEPFSLRRVSYLSVASVPFHPLSGSRIMLYTCTLFTTILGSEPAFDYPLACVTVRGDSLRQAAARAYVRCVGRDRVRQRSHLRPEISGLEASPRAIAASLRKIFSRIGELYEMTGLNQSWFVKVVPSPVGRPQPLLLCCNPSPN